MCKSMLIEMENNLIRTNRISLPQFAAGCIFI